MKTLVLLSALVLLAYLAQADPFPEATEETKNEEQPGIEDQDVSIFLETQKALLFKMQVSGGAQCDSGLESPERGLKMCLVILSRAIWLPYKLCFTSFSFLLIAVTVRLE
uniref:Alpha-defensin N-terminal domain-containing protein n=1 Tax=Peromyscus maniculatus bairdii TaxID=230844 RepID=A0A8C8W7N7_PERMB